MLSEIKAAIELLPGVVSVTNSTSYDVTDCDAYREAMDDVKAGKIFNASSVDDMSEAVNSMIFQLVPFWNTLPISMHCFDCTVKKRLANAGRFE